VFETGSFQEVVKQHLAAGTDLNAQVDGYNSIQSTTRCKQKEIANLLQKHGGKAGKELKAQGK